MAFEQCQRVHHHGDDFYGELAPEEEEEFEVGGEPPMELDDEDWMQLARLLPERAPTQEDFDLLGVRDIDVQYDWNPHVGRYCDERMERTENGKYWKEALGMEQAQELEVMPPESRDTLNPM